MSIREDVHAYLDGELPREALSPEALREVEAWEELVEEARAAGPAGAPAGLRASVMEAVLAETAETAEPAWKRAARWWLRPREVRVSPLAAGLAAAALAALALVLPFGGPGGDARSGVAVEEGARLGEGVVATGGAVEEGAVPEPSASQVVYVKFVLEAPAARSVSLAGNFNGWTPDIPLRDPDGDGVWTATVPMRPGVHEYMFVVDGSNWVTDPNAERYEEDGYGHRNAVLAIAGPRAGT